MGYIQKQNGRYRARFRDPLGRVHSRTFKRRADADRFLLEVEADKLRGEWVDPRDADMPVASWAQEFMALSRRLATTTQETYQRDLDHYVLPRFGRYRLGRLPANEIENWLNDELEAGLAPSSVHRHYRTLRRMLAVAVQKQKLLQNPCDRVDAPRVPQRHMVFLDWEQVLRLADGHSDRFRALIYLAVDSGMRWSELVGLRRARLDLPRRKVRVTEQLVRLHSGEFQRREPNTAARVRSITVSRFTAYVLTDHLDRFAGPGPDGRYGPKPGGQRSAFSAVRAATGCARYNGSLGTRLRRVPRLVGRVCRNPGHVNPHRRRTSSPPEHSGE